MVVKPAFHGHSKVMLLSLPVNGYSSLIYKKKSEILIFKLILLILSLLSSVMWGRLISSPDPKGWVPFKIVSDSPALHSRWLLLLKIEISSIVHCCFSISQNELKF